MSWALAIHGGAGGMTRERILPDADAGARAALGRALDAGAAVLAGGGAALDAVEAAVRVLEDDPHFNAGRGAALSFEGVAELDAAIMEGAERKAGAVAGVTATRHPVSLARAVMERSPHVLLGGSGADAFARAHDIEQTTQDWLILPERAAQLEEMRNRKDGAFDIEMKFGTVGAVACDAAGHVAAATSTGGVTGKRWGRIGDSPLIGAGTYADDRACAVSATGSGEFFIRSACAHEIAARMRLGGEAARPAADGVMAEIKGLGGSGGVIVATPAGELLWSFTTRGMYRARLAADGAREIAIYDDE
ncbi:isoaspartyl peptidase/L-asparaginase family protein [Sphingomonas immobilis]|uniref:Isoaspartyl peptidase/L-asparaginase n=1 Tax=Sphingomonas immobilis TaxID=3063997 RepID=A0ABT9A295_9SPHN|nr:isoaspartyl peptidase/L-asparaginase [Sphingomonas sp. CA1-15]MDO7843946.1 isoaspartyl peptidase/L-asparaginase [Sphingomonas sp. CA1-15]